MPQQKLTTEQRFWAKVNKDAPGKCWLWTAGAFSNGYGCFRYEGRLWRAHRAAWTMFRGPITDGLWILHECDTPLCVNFEECLFTGTGKDNSKDRDRKGRWRGNEQTDPEIIAAVRREWEAALREPVMVNGKPRAAPRRAVSPGFAASLARKYKIPVYRVQYAVSSGSWSCGSAAVRAVLGATW